MAKGSVRKKGRKWYYRFYIEDESGRQVQKEFAGTESKSETEALLRKAMEDYEAKRFVGKAENITVGEMLDLWIEEDLKPSSLSNGTVMAYTAAVKKIKKYPIGSRRLKTVTADHLQAFLDFMSYGGTNPDGTTSPPVLCGAARGVPLCGIPEAADYLQPDAVYTAAGTERGSGHLLRGGSRGGFPTDHHPRAIPEADRLSERQEKSCAAARTDRLLHGASHWRGLRPDVAGHQSG